MGASDPNIVVRLVALNERARIAWAHSHNKSYYTPASFQGFPAAERTSREATPFHGDNDGDGQTRDTEPELRLCFNNRPKDMSKGWVFGSDQNACDIYCGEYDKKNGYYIGRQTFSITMNKQGMTILKHLKDTNRTIVQYDYQRYGDRRKFVWTLFPSCSQILVCSAGQLQFRVIVAKNIQDELYVRLRAHFLADIEKSMPPLPSLSIGNCETTPDTSLVSTPKAQPFYYYCPNRELGRGGNGAVSVVIDVSTGLEYAGKRYFKDFPSSEAAILEKQKHPHILKFISLTHDNGPLLVTELLKGGDLARPWQFKDRPSYLLIDIVCILQMSLSALASLHADPNPAIHRDIKPDNILITGDSPRIQIKLADFGTAVDSTESTGLAGTFVYSAPEMYDDQTYNAKVDVWSLGVVILQLLLEGLIPKPTLSSPLESQYCKDISAFAYDDYLFYNKWLEGHIITLLHGFIAKHMLQLDPKLRLSARECLDHAEFRKLYSHVVEGGQSNHATHQGDGNSADSIQAIKGNSVNKSNDTKTPKTLQDRVQVWEALRMLQDFKRSEDAKLAQVLRPNGKGPAMEQDQGVKDRAFVYSTRTLQAEDPSRARQDRTPVAVAGPSRLPSDHPQRKPDLPPARRRDEPAVAGPSRPPPDRQQKKPETPPTRCHRSAAAGSGHLHSGHQQGRKSEMKRSGSPVVGSSHRKKASTSTPRVESWTSSKRGVVPSSPPLNRAAPYNSGFTSMNALSAANDARDEMPNKCLSASLREQITSEYGEDLVAWFKSQGEYPADGRPLRDRRPK